MSVLDNEAALETSAIRRITMRLVPFLIVCYFVAFLDRVNVGFAALQMNQDLGFSATIYGWGAGIFFLGYFLFEVPSNILLEKTGARIWIARIMISWGVVSACMALVTGTWSFMALRFLLGAMEAGFFPGIILYLTYWFPSEHRAKVVGIFMVAIPISSLLGSPVSGAILGMSGVMGLRGWQWLFILEALPSVLLGLAVLVWLPDRPASATWLPENERQWLARRLEAERKRSATVQKVPLWEVLTQRKVLLLALVYAGSVASSYGLTLWQPQILKSFGLTDFQTGLINAVPFAFGCAAMIWWGRRSDLKRERLWHTAIPLFVCAIGLVACMALATSLSLTILALCFTLVGVYAVKGPFWATSTEMLPAATAAAGIAAINSIGNLAGFVGPFLIGYIKDATGSFILGMVPLIVFAVVAGVVVLVMGKQSPVTVPAE
jgi:ACS family tartrate transporter-like MFS transporter